MEKLDWKTKKFTNKQLAELSVNALIDIFRYLNDKDIRFYNFKLEKTGEIEVKSKTPKYVSVKNSNGSFTCKVIKPGETYITNKYDKVKSYTYSSGPLDTSKVFNYKGIHSIEISSKVNFSLGWSCNSKIQFNFKISLWQLLYIHYKKEVIDNLEFFLDKLPKSRRKKLFKIVYIYQQMDKDEKCFQKIFTKFSKIFNLTLQSTSNYKFDGFEKTISVIDNRNRRINNLLRKRK